MYISDVTIQGGGGRFAQTVLGLFDCEDYNVGEPAPFYGRNRRFRVDRKSTRLNSSHNRSSRMPSSA